MNSTSYPAKHVLPSSHWGLGRLAALVVTTALVTLAGVGVATATTPDLLAVACPSATQCTAIDSQGQEFTFNPQSSGRPAPVSVGASWIKGDIACPSTTQCTAIGGSEEVTFNPAAPASSVAVPVDTTGLLSVSCPTTSQCTAVNRGQEVTFTIAAPGAATPASVDTRPMSGVSCPSATQCTGVDDAGNEVTFNPQSPGTPTPLKIEKDAKFTAVSCPAETQCTALGNGTEVTFSPQSPGTPTPVSVEGSSLACPSTSQCTAIDGTGEVTFNPQSPGTPTSATIDPGMVLAGVSCPSATQCTAVDMDRVLTFNPVEPGTPVPVALIVPPPPAPAEISPPAITGGTVPGMTLTETHAAWRNNPTEFAYRWVRCDVNGASCVTAPNSTSSQTYTLVAADAASTIRVVETAGNAGGSGAATSAATGVVAAAPLPVAAAEVPSVAGSAARVPVTCNGAIGTGCSITVTLTATERLAHGRVVAVTASRGRSQGATRPVTLGMATTTVPGGQTTVVTVALNTAGLHLLKARHTLSAELQVAQTVSPGHSTVLFSHTVAFKATAKHKHKKRKHKRRRKRKRKG